MGWLFSSSKGDTLAATLAKSGDAKVVDLAKIKAALEGAYPDLYADGKQAEASTDDATDNSTDGSTKAPMSPGQRTILKIEELPVITKDKLQYVQRAPRHP